MNSYELTKSICNCSHCGKADATPFCFPMREQEVMLISAVPSLQAMYKPLTSIRFFRNICLALFGDKYLREKSQAEKYLREFCEGNIYWTHYRKCYLPGLSDYRSLNDTCARRFLLDELRLLKPKLVIVLGDEIHEKVREIAAGHKSEWVFMPFPSKENVSEFDELRVKLGKFNKYVTKSGFTYSDGADRYSDEPDSVTGHATHLLFEHDAFEKMLSGQDDDSSASIDDVWHRNLVIPNMRRCFQLVQTYSFVEDQVTTLLSDYFVNTGMYSVLRSFRTAERAPILGMVLKDVKDNWLNALEDYVVYKDKTLENNVRRLTKRIHRLRIYRNAVVHSGGLLDSRDTVNEGENGLEGIFSFAGTVFVSETGKATLAGLAREVTELLCKTQ